jgi:hypothetical protein
VLAAVEFVATNTPSMQVVARAAIKKRLSRWVAPVSNTQLWLANVASHATLRAVSVVVVQVDQV